MFHMPESRFIAFGIHLFISLTLFLTLASFVYFVLLPGFLFYSEGGKLILSLIGGIDVVLGPLLTLIIYNKYKKSIKFDLAIIIAMQAAAFFYGLYSLYSVRPLAVFYAQNEFHVVYESTFEKPTQSNISKNESLHFIKPPTIAIELPQNIRSLFKINAIHIGLTKQSYFSQEHLYSDYKDEIKNLHLYAVTPEEAVNMKIISKDSPLAKLDPKKFGFFQFYGSLHKGYIILNLDSGKFVDIVI